MALSATPDFWWKLDETSGTAAANSGDFGTASDYDFELIQSGGSPSFNWLGSGESWGSGGITGGLELVPGGGGIYYCESDNNLPLQNQTKITIACWTYHTSSDNGDGRIFFQGDTFYTDGHQFMVGEVSNDDARARIRTDTNGGSTFVHANVHPTDDTKVHTVWVLDLTLGSAELKLYIDGNTTPAATWNVTGTDIADDSIFNAAGGLRTLLGASTHNGATPTGWDNPWEGAICDVRIWLDAATASEVAAIYNNDLGAGGDDDLISNDLVAGTPALDSPAIGQTHALSANDLATLAVSLDSSALAQVHALIRNDLAAGTPALDSSAIGQTHALAGIDLSTGAPTLDSPALAQIHALIQSDLTSSAPVLDSSILAQTHVLAQDDLSAGAPLLDSPALGTEGTDALTADDLAAGAPTLDESALGQLHALAGNDLAASAPQLAALALLQIHGLVSDDLAAQTPLLDSPTLLSGSILISDPLTTSAPLLGSPAIGQVHALLPADLATESPILVSPALLQIHALSGADLLGGVPLLDSPALDAVVPSVEPTVTWAALVPESNGTIALQAIGAGTPSFTRPSTATVTQWDGSTVECAPNELRIEGARRVSEGVWSWRAPDGSPLHPRTTIGGQPVFAFYAQRQDSTPYQFGDRVRYTQDGLGYYAICLAGGTSAASQPTMPTATGERAIDGGVTWQYGGMYRIRGALLDETESMRLSFSNPAGGSIDPSEAMVFFHFEPSYSQFDQRAGIFSLRSASLVSIAYRFSGDGGTNFVTFDGSGIVGASFLNQYPGTFALRYGSTVAQVSERPDGAAALNSTSGETAFDGSFPSDDEINVGFIMDAGPMWVMNMLAFDRDAGQDWIEQNLIGPAPSGPYPQLFMHRETRLRLHRETRLRMH